MPASLRGHHLEGGRALYGPVTTQHRFRRRRADPLPRGNPALSDAGAAGRIHAGQALPRAWGQRRGPQARHQPSAARGEDRHGLSRLRPADRRGDLRRQCRPDAGGEALRSGARLPARHLRHVVDQGGDPGIHPALVEPGEDGDDRQPEAAVLQSAQGRRARSRRSTRATFARPGGGDRHQAERQRGRGRVDEPAPLRRRVAQRADPRHRRRIRRMAGLAASTTTRARRRRSSSRTSSTSAAPC